MKAPGKRELEQKECEARKITQLAELCNQMPLAFPLASRGMEVTEEMEAQGFQTLSHQVQLEWAQ